MPDLEDSSPADAELVVRVRSGDAAAFTAIYAQYCDTLCRSVDRMLGSREAAEDVVHTVFTQIRERRVSWQVSGSTPTMYKPLCTTAPHSRQAKWTSSS